MLGRLARHQAPSLVVVAGLAFQTVARRATVLRPPHSPPFRRGRVPRVAVARRLLAAAVHLCEVQVDLMSTEMLQVALVQAAAAVAVLTALAPQAALAATAPPAI